MSTPKPANQDLSQQIANLLNASELETIYEAYMDAMLASLGRDITIYLPPGQTESTQNPEQYNPWQRTKDRRVSQPSDGNAGAQISPISVVYKAHIVFGPRPLGPEVPWQLDIGDVQITTVIGSRDDLETGVEIEVDGIKFAKKKVDLRLIGLTTPKYIISVWSRKADM